jgi:hypothetical protein
MAPTTFGRKVMGDWRLVAELRNGRDLRTSTAQRIRNFMNTYAAQSA